MVKKSFVVLRGTALCRMVMLCIVVMCVLLSGCGPKSPIDDGSIKLVFTYWGNADEKKSMEALVQQFEIKNPGITVQLSHIPSSGDYMTKIATMAASNSLPDAGYFIESSVLKWAENGKLLDLSSLYEDEAIMPKKLDMLRFVDKNGKVVGASLSNEVSLLFYNKDLFDEAGIPYPPVTAETAWTWEEFIDVAKKLTKDNAGRTPNDPGFDSSSIATYGAFVSSSPYFVNPLLWSNGGGILDKDNKTILLNKPESIEVLQALQDMIYRDKVSPAPSSQGTIPALSSALLSRKVAMQFETQYVLQTLHEAKENENLNYGIGVLPKFKEPVSTNGGSPVVAFSTTKHPEEVKKLVAFLMNPENSLPLINDGLWMPNEEQWYTDQELIDRWVKEDVHTPAYKTAVIDYTLECVRSNPYYTYAYTDELYNEIWAGLDPLFGGDKTAQQAVNDILPGLQELMEEKAEK